MTINEKTIKISSKLPIAEEIALGQDLTIKIGLQEYILNCVKTEDRDNQDGTIDKVYVLKYLGE